MKDETRTKTVGMVLCGGHSSRMGQSKALLKFGSETMLARVVRLLLVAVDEVVVVAAGEQPLPPLPMGARVVRDRQPEKGPLEGLAAGLAALEPDVLAVFVTGCDVPLLVPAFVTRVIDLLGEHDCAVPRIDGIEQPLAAAYRPRVSIPIGEMLAEDNRSVRALFERVRTRHIEAHELTDVDPHLLSLRNCNSPADYQAALLAADVSNDC
jgi:molybdopterin-guanine dinucleotide biosynthesis protein A